MDINESDLDRQLRNSKLWEYSDNIFCSNPIVPDIPSSPIGQNHVGDNTSMIYGLDSMAQKGFSQNILSEYSASFLVSQLTIGFRNCEMTNRQGRLEKKAT